MKEHILGKSFAHVPIYCRKTFRQQAHTKMHEPMNPNHIFEHEKDHFMIGKISPVTKNSIKK